MVGIDNLPGSRPLETGTLPRRCVLLFGQEGPGLSEPARAACDQLFSIAQYGSTRSINAGRGQRDRHARLDPGARRPAAGLNGTDGAESGGSA